jgi:hypothetical protein
MAHRRGISGDEIRREQEESRRRSRRGAHAQQLQPSLSIIVTWVEIDWIMPLAACVVRGFGKVGVALAVVAIGIDFFSSKRVKIWRGNDGVHALVGKLWQRATKLRDIVIDAASLRYWNAWFCRGLELRGENVSVAASGKHGSWLRPPLGIPAVSVRPRLRPTARSIALNLPNILLNAGTIAAIWNVNRHSLVIAFFALKSILSSLSNCLLGGPELLVTPLEHQRTASRDQPTQAV